MSAVLTIVVSDLRQRVRDRSVIVFGLVVPLAMIGMFSLLFGDVDEGLDLDPVTVAVAAPDDDEMADALLGVLRDLEVVEVTLDETAAGGVVEKVEAGDATLGLVLPADFASSLADGRDTEVRVVMGGQDDLASGVVVSVVDGVLEQMAAGALAASAGAAAGIPLDEVGDIGRQVGEASGRVAVVEGEAADEQLDLQASLVAGQAGLFLLFTVGFGVMGLVAEREEGTLDRIRSMPIRAGTVVIAKSLTGFLLGVATTSVLLASGSVAFGVSWGALLPVAVLVVCAVAASTSIVLVLARVVRTSEQATVAQSVVAMVLGIAGGAFFPLRVSGAVGSLLELNPVAGLGRGLGITSGGGGLGDLGPTLIGLVAFTIVVTAAARLMPDRSVR